MQSSTFTDSHRGRFAVEESIMSINQPEANYKNCRAEVTQRPFVDQLDWVISAFRPDDWDQPVNDSTGTALFQFEISP
jgi:hypothetical protein